jgi:hypothetical protein
MIPLLVKTPESGPYALAEKKQGHGNTAITLYTVTGPGVEVILAGGEGQQDAERLRDGLNFAWAAGAGQLAPARRRDPAGAPVLPGDPPAAALPTVKPIRRRGPIHRTIGGRDEGAMAPKCGCGCGKRLTNPADVVDADGDTAGVAHHAQPINYRCARRIQADAAADGIHLQAMPHRRLTLRKRKRYGTGYLFDKGTIRGAAHRPHPGGAAGAGAAQQAGPQGAE